MIGAMAFAFLIGTITTVNPCGLALLPTYFARRAGMDAVVDRKKPDAIFHAIVVGVSATTGFVLVFAIVGGAMVLGAEWLADVFPWAGLVIGIALAVTGLAVFAGRQISLRLPMPLPGGNGLSGDFVYGVGYAIVSLSCSLPIFLTVTGITFSGNYITSALDLIAFALGVGTVLTALSVSAAFAHGGLAGRLKRFLPYASRASGGILFLAGLYVSYLWGAAIFMLPGGDMLAMGEILSGMLQGWLGGPLGQALSVGVLVSLVTVFVWIKWNGKDMPKNRQS